MKSLLGWQRSASGRAWWSPVVVTLVNLMDVLAILFGIGSWIAVNGMWVELPILVQELPEQWNLPSYLSVIIQLANVAPIAYSVYYIIFKYRSNETYFIHVMMTIGVVACILLAFLWKKTGYIGGSEHSVALITLIFFLAIVDCSSSVLFFPFMGLFKSKYMTPFLIGESLSGFIPSIVALGQGAGSTECRNTSHFNATANETTYHMQKVFLQPRFSIEVFFFFLAGMTITSWTAFSLLRYHSVADSEKVLKKLESEVFLDDNFLAATVFSDNTVVHPQADNRSQIANNNDETSATMTDDNQLKTPTLTADFSSEELTEKRPLPKRKACNLSKSCAKRAAVDCKLITRLFFSVCLFVTLLVILGYGSMYPKARFKVLRLWDTLNHIPVTSHDNSHHQYEERELTETDSEGSSTSKKHPYKVTTELNAKNSAKEMSKSTYILFLVIQAWICFLSNGVLPSIQTYSCLPYGNIAYHLSVTLSSIASPAVCVLALFITLPKKSGIAIQATFGTIIACFLLATALLSPTPPLVGQISGQIIIVSILS
ncbi:Solute carrier family 52, riboflavin transporter, member 3-A [Nymphon striatum]|nr:Solute carrier family 52, riboflavin transporter, member 3-A [Nymphon striatum]